jgi:hypothetical protein
MKKTLESFIDPVNIPKKYGGQLEFEFGDFPVLDPALQKVVEWEEGKDNFPHGPMYWVDQMKGVKWEEGKGGEKIKAIAVGSVGEKERNEEVCTVTRLFDPITEGFSNGEAINGAAKATRPEFLRVPTATSSVNDTVATPIESLIARTAVDSAASKFETNNADSEDSGVKLEINGEKPDAGQEDELVPASRPEPVKFITAKEGIETLTLNEKAGNLLNGSTGPHETPTVNRLDPNLTEDGGMEHTNGAAITPAEPVLKEKVHDGIEVVNGQVGL